MSLETEAMLSYVVLLSDLLIPVIFGQVCCVFLSAHNLKETAYIEPSEGDAEAAAKHEKEESRAERRTRKT